MATLTELQTYLTELKAARTAILSGAQKYTGMSGKISVERADLASINQEIEKTELKINMISKSGRLSHAQAVFGGSR